MWTMIESALDLVSSVVDLLSVSSVSVPVLQFIGIVIIVLLLGVLLGRMTKRGIRETAEHSREQEESRVSLDFERLTPLGPSKEEAAGHPTMDISTLRSDHIRHDPAVPDQDQQHEPPLLKE
jgi:hypothetical protein